MMFLERINTVEQTWIDESPETRCDYYDNGAKNDHYEYNHTDLYMHMIASQDPNNYLDPTTATIIVNGKEYHDEEMYLYHLNHHTYLLTKNDFILIDYLDDYQGIPFPYSSYGCIHYQRPIKKEG